MSIKYRILALLSLLSLFSIGTFVIFDWSQVQEAASSRQQRIGQVSATLQRLLNSAARGPYRYLRNYAGRSSMVEYLRRSDPAWADKYLKGRMDTYHIDLLWVLKADGTLIYGFDRITGSPLAAPPLPWSELQAVTGRNTHFRFHELLGGELYQIQGMPIMPTEDLDRKTPALGWLIAAKHWGEPLLEDLADSGQGRVMLTGTTHHSDTRSPQELEAWQALVDHRGQTIAGVDFHVNDPMVEDPTETYLEYTIFVINSVSSVLLAGILLHFFVLRPFLLVRTSLLQSDPAPLAPLLGQSGEFGQMARIVQTSLLDREQLVRVHEERVQLARDLHDGVIQRVYGAGMVLSRVQSLLSPDQTAAQGLLAQTRGELNWIIGEIRGHIEKVDPRPLDTTFGEAVTRLIQQLHGAGRMTTELNIDESLVADYAPLERIQLLQFVSEAVSNALRHGAPSRLAVTWQRSPGGSMLVVGDDGRGFIPDEVKSAGRGLGNLRERAFSLGGQLQIESQENHGTRVCLKLPSREIAP